MGQSDPACWIHLASESAQEKKKNAAVPPHVYYAAYCRDGGGGEKAASADFPVAPSQVQGTGKKG